VPELMNTREVAEYLRIKERKVYDLVRGRRIPCTRVAGKWLFPKTLIDLWVLRNTRCDPAVAAAPRPAPVIVGSHDPLLEWAARESGCEMAILFGGSLDGLRRFAQSEAAVCGLHVFDPETRTYNEAAVKDTLADLDVVLVEWAEREQGLVVAAGNPQLIYFPVFVKAGGFICSQMRDVPGLEETLMMGADGIYTPDFVKACGANAVGMYWSSPDFSAFGAGYAALVEKYKTKYNVEGTLAPFHAHSYDAANIIFAAIEKVAVVESDGSVRIGRQALRDAIAATKDFPGLTGSLTCNENGDCADPLIAVYQMKDTAEFDAAVAGQMPKVPVWKAAK